MIPWYIRLLLGKTGLVIMWLLLVIGIACLGAPFLFAYR
jgi:hypothetical protein